MVYLIYFRIRKKRINVVQLSLLHWYNGIPPFQRK